MRKLDNNRIEEFVKKHTHLKRWISIMLVVALLVTTATMYSLNKSANALSDADTEDVGMILEGTEDDTAAEGEDAPATDSDQENDNADSADGDSTDAAATEEQATSDTEESTEDASLDAATDASTDENTDSENAPETDLADASGENTSDDTTTEPAADETGTDDKTENEENKAVADGIKDSSDVELTQDVVLTVSYVTEDGEQIADEKEISLAESLDFATEAPKQEGYEFKKATIDGNEITRIEAKLDANEYKYYVVTLKNNSEDSSEVSDGNAETEETDEDTETVVIKEDKTVVLTYKSLEANKTTYVYEDAKVRVTAILEKPDAVPDDAEFVVKEVTTDTEGYNYDAYLKALNDGQESTVKNHNPMNTILYDVGFFVNKTDEEGNVVEGEKVEYQPKEGSVTVKFEFLDNQLTHIAESTEEEGDIEINHLPLNKSVKDSVNSTSEATDINASDIEKEKVESTNGSDKQNVEISLDNFSIVGFSSVNKQSNVYTFRVSDDRTLTYTENSTKDAFRGSSHDNQSLALGVAGNFHIVAFNEAKLNVHTNGNVLAKTLYANANFGTNNIEDELSYAQELRAVNERMASGTGHTLALGTNVYVGLYGTEGFFSINGSKVAAPYNIIQDTDTNNTPYIDLATVKAEIKAISDKMAGTSDGDVTISDDTDRSKVFTYTGAGGAGYVNFTGAKWNNLVSGNQLKFVFPENYAHQSIIININCSDVTTILKPTKASYVSVNGVELSTGEEKAVDAGRIVYNFYNVDNKNVALQEVFGQVIALGANLTIDKGNGNFVAENVTVSGETHRRDFVGTTEKGAVVTLQAKKLFNGKEPSANQKFTFKAQKLVANPENTHNNVGPTDQIITGTNDGSSISIDVSEFIENKEGKYLVLLTEEAGTDASIHYDSKRYLAEITIGKTQEGNKIIYSATDIQYYEEGFKPINADQVVFNNTIEETPVPISVQKYVDGELAADNTTGKFNFTLRMLDSANNNTSWKKDASGKIKTASMSNTASEITYNITPTEWDMEYGYDTNQTKNDAYKNAHTYYFMLTEDDVDGYAKDSSAILIKVKHYEGGEVNYYRINADEAKSMLSAPGTGLYRDANRIKNDNSNSDVKYHNVAFYNATGSGLLRIHKMVINDFGSALVRDDKESILNCVVFKVTNTATKNYIVVHGFTGGARDKKEALEYNSSHVATGNKYNVYYNQGAQWTIEGLSAGTYTVEEVGDGFTFEYSEENDKSSLIPASKWSRVTKYDVTVDNETTEWRYGRGGNNERVVFSADLTTDGNTDAHHLDTCPVVSVGDSSIANESHTQTVQVCNYYSIPVGPIRVTKKFTGGTWKDMNFTFNIEAVSCVAKDSAGNEIPGVECPRPERTTVTLSNPTVVDKAVSSAVADFGSIAFRYEGEYIYKITEEDTGIDGVTYDSNVYYVKVDVVKKYTTATKTYSAGNMTSIAKYKYNGETTTIRDDFYYLGADLTYTNKMGEVIAQYELYLKPIDRTSENFSNEFDIKETYGSLDNVVFNNVRTGKLAVKKVWLDSDNKDEQDKHTSLVLSIWQRVKGSTEWTKYPEEIVLAPNKDENNNWKATVTGLPIVDENGNLYEYTVKEDDSYIGACEVTYQYTDGDGKTSDKISGNDQPTITVDGLIEHDTAYSLQVGSDGINFGEVTITNRSLVVNTLPASGGMGTLPFMIMGAVMIITALGAIFISRRKKD